MINEFISVLIHIILRDITYNLLRLLREASYNSEFAVRFPRNRRIALGFTYFAERSLLSYSLTLLSLPLSLLRFCFCFLY